MLHSRPLSGCKHRYKKRPKFHRQGNPVFNIEIWGHGGSEHSSVIQCAWWAPFTPAAAGRPCSKTGARSHRLASLWSAESPESNRKVGSAIEMNRIEKSAAKSGEV
eukprot:1602317-Pyramimonas_sp.AAC.1